MGLPVLSNNRRGVRQVNKYQFHDDSGEPMDTHFEMRDGMLILCSRGGKQNTHYHLALPILLERIERSELVLDDVLVDSKPVQKLPRKERRIFRPEDTALSPRELFTELSKRMAKVGSKSPKGNSARRLRFEFAGNLSDKEIAMIVGRGETKSAVSKNEPPPPNSSDSEWDEGNPKLQTHLKLERAPGVAKAKRKRFIEEHGRLHCERCGLVPEEVYGLPHGDACIEVHHTIPLTKKPRKTKLEDLTCVCANCHRVIHRELQNFG